MEIQGMVLYKELTLTIKELVYVYSSIYNLV